MEVKKIKEKQFKPHHIFYDIHKDYFKRLQEAMKQDAEEILSLLETDPKEADERFSKSIRQLWACFEKSDDKHILRREKIHLPYRDRFNESEGNNFIGPTRPKFSGWLVEIYVYYFIKKLLERESLDKRSQVLNSEKLNGLGSPDVIIKRRESKREGGVVVTIEVKTFIMSKDQVKSILSIYEKCSERDIKFYLFCCEISKKYLGDVRRNLNISNIKPTKKKYIETIEGLENSEEWVYLPYLGRLKRIVSGVIQPLKES